MRILGNLFLALCLALSLSFASCGKGGDDVISLIEKSDTLRNLTFVYIMAENSLSNYAASDILEMKKAADEIPSDCKLLLFVDDVSLPRICQVYSDGVEGQCDVLHTFEDDFSSSDIGNAEMVFEWVNKNYPARSFNVVMWSHGSGWVSGKKSPCQRSIGIDNGNNDFSNSTSAAIDIDELAVLLQKQPVKPSMLLFDACFMQTLETAYALRGSAEWIVASPAEIPAKGAPYDLLMEHFFAEDFDAGKVVDAYCADYMNRSEGVVLSVVDCGAMEQLAECCARFVPQAFAREKGEMKSVFSYLPGGYSVASKYYYPDYSDANAVMRNNLSVEEYDRWYLALKKAVPYWATTGRWYSAVHRTTYSVDKSVYSGVSMYVPREGNANEVYNADFLTTEWYKAAGWSNTGW